MNLTPIEKEKLQFLEKVQHEQNTDFLLEVGIFDLKFNLHLSGISQKDYDDLIDYYKHFKVNESSRETLDIYYYAFEDQKKSLNHEWYCSKYPTRRFINSKKNSFYIIERDYASYFDYNALKVFAYGPRPGRNNPDSLDNLLTTLFSSLNTAHDCLILHSATVIRNKKAYVFFGESGAGKSTLAFHCYQKFNQKIISSDQTYLRWDGEKIWAQSTPITIPEIKRDTPMREWSPIEVEGFIHLTQRGKIGLNQLKVFDFLKKFVCQSDLYLTPLSDQQKFLNIVQALIENGHLLGELCYKKNDNFWKYFP